MGLVSLSLTLILASSVQAEVFPESEILNGPGIDYVPQGSSDFVPKTGPIKIGEGAGVTPPINPAVPAKFTTPSWFSGGGKDKGKDQDKASQSASKYEEKGPISSMQRMATQAVIEGGNTAEKIKDMENKPWVLRDLKEFADNGIDDISKAASDLVEKAPISSMVSGSLVEGNVVSSVKNKVEKASADLEVKPVEKGLKDLKGYADDGIDKVSKAASKAIDKSTPN